MLSVYGNVCAWGLNSQGQLGSGNTNHITALNSGVLEAQKVGVHLGTANPIQNIKQISAGAMQSMAIRADGTVWTWGENSSNQCASPGSGSPVTTPVQAKINVGSNTFVTNATNCSSNGDFNYVVLATNYSTTYNSNFMSVGSNRYRNENNGSWLANKLGFGTSTFFNSQFDFVLSTKIYAPY